MSEEQHRRLGQEMTKMKDKSKGTQNACSKKKMHTLMSDAAKNTLRESGKAPIAVMMSNLLYGDS